ncbi:MAG TPA: 5-(carboxyamino)imidazole ribonucleotide mutase [Candidatus Saccharimonadales bacterium]|nr:5-(carboxyamino)imidazole ribonucleotide mutase [Candidatus Saccharimonadales bacterium]
MDKPSVGIIMGSKSDKDIMDKAAQTLDELGVAYELRIVSAHRTPDVMDEYAATARERGLKVIIAGAGGSAHLPGMTASHTTLPVIAVPIKRNENDHEALWSNIKMPPGIPLATMPENGAGNAALMAVEILSLNDDKLAEKYQAYRQKMHDAVIEDDKNINNNL